MAERICLGSNRTSEGTGLIFNIQRFSVHDGSGIRTTVFMKGCRLNCRWCSNPESIRPYPEIMTSDSRCILCGRCAQVCPKRAITLDSKRKIDRLKCDLCLKCVEVCPTGAIRVTGQYATVDEVMSEIMKDELFYQNSGGGVTISGGEPLLQWEFVRSLLSECKQEGIHTALDTSGYASWAVLSKVLACVDLALYDIKHTDPQYHKSGTGGGNRQILTNFRLTASKVRTWLRVPIIPGYNDSKDNITIIAKLAKETKVEKVSLLPYHQLGKAKYEQLSRRYTIRVMPPSEEHLLKLQKLIENQGVKTTIRY